MLNSKGKTIRVGAQAITWGEIIREQMPHILAYLAECGYHGAEIGVRHFDTAKPEYYRDLFAEHGVQPVATHSGGTFWNKEQAAAEMANVEVSVDFAAALGCPYFAMSGNPQETGETMAVSAQFYNRIGALCRDRNIQLAYHNHNWEFANDAAVFNALIANTDPDLVHLVPDIAWLHRAGQKPADVLRAHADRLAFLHFKDTAGEDDFCELGRGDVDFVNVIELLPQLGVDWIVAEQDSTHTTAEESLKITADFLRDRGLL